MKIFNKLSAALMALPLLAGLTACSDDHAEYTPADADDLSPYVNANLVYFPKSVLSATTQELDANATSFDIEVERSKTEGAVTLPLISTQSETSSTKLIIPESVTFADGEAKATITIAYDPTSMDYDDLDTVSIELSEIEGITVPVEQARYDFEAFLPAPWISLGMGKFLDAFIYDDETWFDVEIQQDANDELHFRLVHPYDEMMEKGEYISEGVYKQGSDPFFEFFILPKGYTLYGVEATQHDYVYYNDVRTGYYISDYDNDSSDGEVYAVFPGRFTNLQSEEAWEYNIVAEYQEDGTPGHIKIAPYYYIFGTGGWNRTANDGIVQILFPGYELSDYSVSATYAGILKTAAGENQAVVDILFGADVASAKYALTDASVSEADAAAGIVSGEIEATDAEAGRSYIPLEEDGKYRVTVVTFDAEGNARESVSTVFEFEAGGSSWESLGMALYTDDLIEGIFSAAVPVSYEVEVLESTKTPGLYRLKNPYGEAYPYNEDGDWDDSMDYFLEIDATDPNAVSIDAQELGLDWGYGMISVVGVATGTLANGVITFPEKAFYLAMAGYNGGNWSFYGNPSGAFKLVLPGAAEAKAFKSVAKKYPHMRVSKTIKAKDTLRPVIVKDKKIAVKNRTLTGRQRIARVKM